MGKIGHIVKLAKSLLKKKKYKKSDFGAIGEGCIINPSSILVPQNMFLGNNVIIQGGVNFISYKGKLIVKQYSVISAGCIMIPSRHLPAVGVPFYYTTKNHIGDEDSTITVEEDCWIGAGSILLPGVIIGRGSIIGAGSVVTKTTPPYSVVVGSPARIISVKFSVEDILAHEKKLYHESERFSEAQLKEIFDLNYSTLPISRKTEISEIQGQILIKEKIK